MLNPINIWVIKNTIKILEIFLTIIEREKTKKTISTDNWKIDIKVPRDKLSTFEPMIVKNHERNISRIEAIIRKIKGKNARLMIAKTYTIIWEEILWQFEGNIRSIKSCISKCSHSKMCYPSNKKFYKTCIYKSLSYDAALKALDSFEKSWGEKYPYSIKSWKK